MFRHIQIAVDPDAKGGKKEIEEEVRMAFAAPALYEGLFLCYRALLRSAQHEKIALDFARYALTAATGEEPPCAD